jgi:hypothetical protein
MTRATMQLALDALDTCDAHLEVSGMNYGYYFNQEAVHNAVKALAATLAQPEPAPVLWVMTTPIGGKKFVIESESEAKRFAAMGDRSVVPFYAAPDTYRNPADDAALKRPFDTMESGIVAELVNALRGVIRVADRATDEFDAARAAIEKATEGQP